MVAIVAILGTFAGLILFNSHDGGEIAEEATTEPEPQPQDYEASIVMVGDALIHDLVYKDAYTGSGYDFKPQIAATKPIVQKYDLAYYNQETVLGGTALGLSSYPMFNSPQEVGDAFIDSGFNLVSLATNHTMDKGEKGVLSSVDYWQKHPEVVTSGQWASAEDRAASVKKTYEINGIKYAFFSYTCWTNGLETPAGKEYLNNVYSKEKAQADISAIRDQVDAVIVAMHWGIEYNLGVRPEQEQVAQELSEMGVDLIIGAHPHVVEPVEYINNGKTLVIYSLGNFISDQDGNERLTGLMMEAKIRKHVDQDGVATVKIVEPRAQLTYTVKKPHFRVYLYSQIDNSTLAGHDALQTKYRGVVASRYPELTWGLSNE